MTTYKRKVNHRAVGTFPALRSAVNSQDLFKCNGKGSRCPAFKAYYQEYLLQHPHVEAQAGPDECLYPYYVRGRAIVDQPSERKLAYLIVSSLYIRAKKQQELRELARAERYLRKGYVELFSRREWETPVLVQLAAFLKNPGMEDMERRDEMCREVATALGMSLDQTLEPGELAQKCGREFLLKRLL